MLTPAEIRERLEINRMAKERGDVASGRALLAEEGLTEFEANGYGVIPSSGIPYENGAGAPGVNIKIVSAGVLVPIINRDEGLTVLLTRRTDGLAKHAGQVAFPGGRVDDSDADQVEAALREAHEEVGIVPVVGFISLPPETFRPEPGEVAAVFEVPLPFLLDRSNHQKVRRIVNGLERAYYAMPYGFHYIWGATAGMIVNLSEVLSD